MRLNKFKGTEGVRNWCGPTAMSVLTGRSVGYCAQLCAYAANTWRYQNHRSFRHTKKTIKGVSRRELEQALLTMKFKMVLWHLFNGERLPCQQKTLFRLMEEMRTSEWRQALLINVTDHYVVAQKGIIYDNHALGGVDYRKFWARRRKVDFVWTVERK